MFSEFKQPFRSFRNQAGNFLVLFQPTFSSKPRGFFSSFQNNWLVQAAIGLSSLIGLLILSGISIVAMASLMTTLLLIFLIMDRILGIEIQLAGGPF